MPESHIVLHRTKSNNGCDITALKTTKAAFCQPHHGCDLRTEGFFFLSGPRGKPPLLEVKHTRGSIIKHGKRKLLSNVIHDKWKHQYNCNACRTGGDDELILKSFFGLICTSANASRTINQNNLEPNFIIHRSFAPPTTFTDSEKLG